MTRTNTPEPRDNFWLPTHQYVPEPDLAFHPDRTTDRDKHPLKGLAQFGPYSRSMVSLVNDPIRLAVIAPVGGVRTVASLIGELEERHKPQERRDYLPDFDGMSRIFGVRPVLGPDPTQIELPSTIEAQMAKASRPIDVLATHIKDSLRALSAMRSEFHVVCVYLPNRWSAGFQGADDEDFDLHDYVKGIGASLGISTQILLEDSVMRYPCRASVAWRISIALYTKAGGVPWALADVPDGTAFVGLSYAIRATNVREDRFVTCCSQVFDDDGSGLEFIAYDTRPQRVVGDNPFLSREEMRRVMTRSLDLYAHHHGGHIPQRVMVHKSTYFTPAETEGCEDAFQAVPEVALIQVQDDNPWLGVRIDPGWRKGAPPVAANYPIKRGALLPVGDNQALLWTSGNAPDAVGGKNFYKEGKGVPYPLLLHCFAGPEAGMNWRGLYLG